MTFKRDEDAVPPRDYIEITCNASEAAQAIRTPKEGFLTSLKEGSSVALWSPHGFPEAIIVAHPDDPPRLVYFDGTEEELKASESGAIILPPVAGHSAEHLIGIKYTANPDRTVEWSSPQDLEDWRQDAQESVNEYFNAQINRTRDDDELVLGKRRWTEEDHKDARRCCPTCGTPACNHPDRVRGEDALPIPPEALIAGRTMLANFLPAKDWRTIEMIVEGIFREMLEKCSK